MMKKIIYLICITLLIGACNKQEPIEVSKVEINVVDSLVNYYQIRGLTTEAANIVAGFELDLYEESDSAEYKQYLLYSEILK